MEEHSKNICFLVDIDFTYVQAVVPRVRKRRALPYEVNIDETFSSITTLLAEEIDKNAPSFGTYDVAKAKITTTLLTEKVDRKKDKMMKRLVK